ncbi:TIGR04222 domain-containing membrane protein [Streptomyces uncialis]|uniref:TIGR04222 domain-containing membrane protein n=1 Tax=Streptomyces uncialis TaxID=1048205 RepID=UPI00366105C9
MGTLQGYIVGTLIALAAIGAVAGEGRRLRAARRALDARIRPPRSADTPLDLYEVAYLCGGAGRVAVVAVVRMHAEGRLPVRARAARWITAEPSGEPRDGVEAAVLGALAARRDDDGRSPWPVELFDSDPPVRDLRERLVLAGLLRDRFAPVGVLHHHPVSRAYYRACARFARTLRLASALAVAGVVIALLWRAYPPLLVYPPLLWAGRRHRDRYDAGTGSYGEVTDAGRAAVRATDAADGPVTADRRQVCEVARSGPDSLPVQHILRPAPAPPWQPPEPGPEPPRIVIDGSPGLGGL